MKKNNKIIYKNFIQKEFLNSYSNKKINKKFSDILNNITINLDKSKSIFNFLSRNFKLNFKIKDMNKFKKFNLVVIVGMGGSTLGAEAIYFFLKKKIKKDFLFLDNIDEYQLLKIKNAQKVNKTLFILITSNYSKMIDTVKSRCQIIFFPPISIPRSSGPKKTFSLTTRNIFLLESES